VARELSRPGDYTIQIGLQLKRKLWKLFPNLATVMLQPKAIIQPDGVVPFTFGGRAYIPESKYRTDARKLPEIMSEQMFLEMLND